MNITVTNPSLLRYLSGRGLVASVELYKADKNGHKFNVGDKCELFGLESFPEHNGETVTITAIRQDGTHGKAYYVDGKINQYINWVYEYRLKPCTTNA